MKPVSMLVFLALAAASPAFGLSVADLGAVGDGATDCTPAFQKALDEAAKAGGGIVDVPAGRYRINGNLSIPSGVTLQGTYRAAPVNSSRNPQEMSGSVLLAYAGRGSADGKPFIELSGPTATVAGFIIAYPEVKTSDIPPVPYPPCIKARQWTDNVAVLDCLLLNPYEGIHLDGAGRHLVRNVYGYPIKRGIFVDQCYDIGRIENVHFWPFGVDYKPDDPFCQWINLNGIAFEFARTDWQYVTNTFCFGYGVGYKFSEHKNGGCNGNFLGIGADCCQRAVLVEQAQRPGILITNGEFVGRWSSTDAVTMEISEKAEGKVSLSNCSFWGPIEKCVWMRSSAGQFTASACNFVDWDTGARRAPCVALDAGKAILQGNTFGDGQVHVSISQRVSSAIISGNQANDGLVVENRAGARSQIFGNQQEAVVFSPDARAHYRLAIGAEGDGRRLSNWHGREAGGEFPAGGTKRWSGPGAQLLLPVVKGKPYDVTIEVYVPEHAIQPDAGIYLGGKCVMPITKPGFSVLKGTLPASVGDTLKLDVKCKTWLPRDVMTGNQDGRSLGIAVRSVFLRAKGSPARVFNGNTGEWEKQRDDL